MNFQTIDLFGFFYLYHIQFILKSMETTHLIKISLKEIIFSYKSLGRKLCTLSFKQNIK
jgi:hypothetical protein